MTEFPIAIDNFDQAVAAVNTIIGLPDRVPIEAKSLPPIINITTLWQVIAESEKQEEKCPFGIEIFWGIDSLGDKLILTELTLGSGIKVLAKDNHLVGIHSHVYKKKAFGSFLKPQPMISPNEIAHILDVPTQYAELIFTRAGGELYPACLAIKTFKAFKTHYQNQEDLKQTLDLLSTISHNPFWSRDKKLVTKCDRFAGEKGIAIYRGIINPRSGRQKDFLLTNAPFLLPIDSFV